MSEKKGSGTFSVKLRPLADGSPAARARLARLAGRGDGDGGDVEAKVRAILAAVRRRGDRAVASYTERFDGVVVRAGAFEIGRREIAAARKRVDPRVVRALGSAAKRIERFHRLQLERGYDVEEDGIRTGMRVLPLQRAGVYVPGGRAAYPSSVLMNIIPARVAGVPDITVVTPPSSRGIDPAVLVAAELAGATRILGIGGAQAVAALAYGTESIARVDKIVGPGNIFVATAKRLVFGQVDIDMIAGPTEVLILADRHTRADWVAADMLAQAEHDPLAAAICVTTDRDSARAISAEVDRQLGELPRAAIAAESLARYGTLLVVASVERAVELANEIAPEHLELFVRGARRWLPALRNAGAIFVGEHTSEPLGDYAAGPNHVLPTGGSARFASPLGVYDLVKRTSIIEIGRRGVRALAPAVIELARAEGLEAHARAVARRLDDKR